MFKSSRWFVVVSIVLLLGSVWQPTTALAAQPAAALAAQPTAVLAAQPAAGSALVTLVVNNQSGANLTLSLSGAGSYTFTLGGGKTKVQVARGKYQYRYYACGAYQSGALEVKKANQKFVIKKCAAAKKTASKPANTVKVNVDNNTGGFLTIILSGAGSYTFTVPNGKGQIYAPKGKYTYTVRGVCGTESGTINIRNGLRWHWWCF
jgi:hypothetical protein